jgi:uncharacterized protein
MSQQNVELMRAAFQAFSSGDLQALSGVLDPNVTWKAVEDPEPLLGFDGVLQSLSAWFEVWDDFHFDLEELIDAGDNVVAIVNMRGRHADSPHEITERFFQVWMIRDRKIVRFREYKAKRDALEAAGLWE